MKYKAPTFGEALTILVLGLILGTVFIFGIQHWNEKVSREDCTIVESLFLSYNQRWRVKGNRIKEISVDCSNDERYFIGEVLITEELNQKLSELHSGDRICLLIHPNSSKIMELSAGETTLISFEDSSKLMQGEKTGFLILGALCYVFALVCGYYSVRYGIRYIKRGA